MRRRLGSTDSQEEGLYFTGQNLNIRGLQAHLCSVSSNKTRMEVLVAALAISYTNRRETLSAIRGLANGHIGVREGTRIQGCHQAVIIKVK